MLELRIIAAGAAVPLFDLPAALGKHEAARGIADTIEGLIAFLDHLGGDPDIEPNGDELDGTAGEDDFYPHSNWLGAPGCPVSDPDGCAAGEDGGRASKPEGGAGDSEDAEEDDPSGDALDAGELGAR